MSTLTFKEGDLVQFKSGRDLFVIEELTPATSSKVYGTTPEYAWIVRYHSKKNEIFRLHVKTILLEHKL